MVTLIRYKVSKQKVSKGLYHGRQPDLEAHDRIASFTEAGFSINKTAEAVGVSRSTVIRVRKKLKNLD